MFNIGYRRSYSTLGTANMGFFGYRHGLMCCKTRPTISKEKRSVLKYSRHTKGQMQIACAKQKIEGLNFANSQV